MKDNHISLRLSGGRKSLKESKWSLKKLSEIFPGLFRGQSGSHSGPYGVAKVLYDFSVHGGAIGTIDLLPADQLLPVGAIITRAYIDVITTFVGVNATIGVTVQGAGDEVATNTAVTSWAAGLLEGISDGTAAKMIKLTADRNVSLAIATAALTAGKAAIFIEYVISQS